MIEITVTLTRDQRGTRIGEYTACAADWRAVVCDISSWLDIEVLPHWPVGMSLRLSWPAETDPILSAALWGLALSCALVDRPDAAPAGSASDEAARGVVG